MAGKASRRADAIQCRKNSFLQEDVNILQMRRDLFLGHIRVQCIFRSMSPVHEAQRIAIIQIQALCRHVQRQNIGTALKIARLIIK